MLEFLCGCRNAKPLCQTRLLIMRGWRGGNNRLGLCHVREFLFRMVKLNRHGDSTVYSKYWWLAQTSASSFYVTWGSLRQLHVFHIRDSEIQADWQVRCSFHYLQLYCVMNHLYGQYKGHKNRCQWPKEILMGLIFKLPLSWCTMTSANIITFSHHTTYSTQHSHDSKRWCPIIYFDEKVSLLVTFSANSSFGLLRNFLSSWFPFYFKLVNQKKYENGYVQNPI